MKQLTQYLLFSLLLVAASSLSAQCLLDRHNTSLSSHWMSCTPTQHPNPIRGVSHWLLFEFDEYKGLGNLDMWNMNHPEYLTSGMNQIAIDVSNDGVNWNEVFIGNLPIGEAMSDYSGQMVADLSGNVANYVAITSLSNHGGTCHGLAEIKIGMADFPCIDDIVTVMDNPVQAGVYSAELNLNSTGSVQNNEVWMFGGEEVCLDIGFEVSTGATFIAANTPCRQQ